MMEIYKRKHEKKPQQTYCKVAVPLCFQLHTYIGQYCFEYKINTAT